MQPESLAGKAETRFIATDDFYRSQTGCHSPDEWVQTTTDASLTVLDPPFADSTAGEGFNYLCCSFQRNEVLHMQIDREASQAGAVLSWLLSFGRRVSDRDFSAVTRLMFHHVFGNDQWRFW